MRASGGGSRRIRAINASTADALPKTRISTPLESLSTSPERSRSRDRKSTRLNSSHVEISYAVFCLKKKTTIDPLLLPAQDRRHAGLLLAHRQHLPGALSFRCDSALIRLLGRDRTRQ